MARRLALCSTLLFGCAGADATVLDAPALCSPAGQSRQALSIPSRAIIGSPADYPASTDLASEASALARSQRLRREAAWQIVRRVLEPVPLAYDAASAAPRTLPLWQTWHASDDITRIFRHLYPSLGPVERAQRQRFSAAAIDEAWRWNDRAAIDFEAWTESRLDSYAAAAGAAEQVAGLAGIYRVTYSPAASRHLIESYADLLGCGAEPESPPPRQQTDPCAPPSSNSPVCLAGHFPSASTLVKASWRRAGIATGLPTFDTSAGALARRLNEAGELSWGEGDGDARPEPSEIYTLTLPNGNSYQLAGLHIMTKELEHWFWITLWWSPEPDLDFGADRPASLPPPFQNYKLCSVVDHRELDPDPAGGFGTELPSLGAALAATHAGEGGPSWCSNPYLEQGEGNAATNCIGCHQHAGTGLGAADVLGSPHFAERGREQLRTTFPSDYVFDATTGDNLRAVFEETEDHFAAAAP